MNRKEIIAISVIVVLLLISGWQYQKARLTGKKYKALQNESQIMKLRIRGDDLFIRGLADSARIYYQQIDSIAGDTLEVQRISQASYFFGSRDSVQLAELQSRLSRAQVRILEYQQRISSLELMEMEEPIAEFTIELDADVEMLREQIMEANREIQRLNTERGVITFSSSKNGFVTYFGVIKDGLANGKGYGYWKSGSSYEGEWFDNMRHGQGVFEWQDGEKYEGQYEFDQRHGFGIYLAKAGKYEGEWKDDMRHGEGKLYDPNGKLKLQGIWEKDKLIKTIK